MDIKCVMSKAYRVLKFPTPTEDQKKPIQILMVGHGTGIAPFVSMLQKIDNQKLHDAYAITLVYGIRDTNESFLYKEMMMKFFDGKPQHKLILAVSRGEVTLSELDQSVNPLPLCYKGRVQQVLRENSQHMQQVLQDESSYIMICGNKLSMGKEVTQTLVQIRGNDGQAWMDKAVGSGRLMMEVWGE